MKRTMEVQLKETLEEETHEGHSDPVASVAIDGDTIVSGSDDQTVKIWSITSGECFLKTLEGHSGYVASVAIDGDMIVSGSFDQTVKVWSKTSGECLQTLEGHSCFVFSAVIAMD